MKSGGRLLETRRALERDVARHEKPRERGSLLRALALIGSVGWPIALLTTGGALLGRVIDDALGTGSAVTLALLAGGALGGSAIAARSLLRDEGLRGGDA
jgi:hypothetical protein